MGQKKAERLLGSADNLKQLNTTYVDLTLVHSPCDRSGKPSPLDQKAWNGAHAHPDPTSKKAPAPVAHISCLICMFVSLAGLWLSLQG